MTVPVVGASYRRTSRALRAGLVVVPIALLLSAQAGPANAQAVPAEPQAGPADAQIQFNDRRLAVVPKAGLAVPARPFGDYLNPGPSAGLRLAYELRPGTALIAEGGFDRFRGARLIPGVYGPNMRAVRFAAGMETEVMPPEIPDWSLRFALGGGVMRIESDEFRRVHGIETLVFRQTSPMAKGGVALGYSVGRGIVLFADAGLNWAYVNKDDTQILASLAPNTRKPFGSALTLPFQFGIRAHL